MPFTYPSVEIGSTPYDVYADIEDADLYIDASIAPAADTWRDTTLTTATIKARALVSGTRWLDSVLWQGEKTDVAQTHAFPRKNLTYTDGTVVASDVLPSQLIAACIELGLALADNTSARAELTDLGLKAIRAGSVSLDYFRPEGNTQVQTPFPAVVMSLISQWLAGSLAVGAIGYDTDSTSHLLDDDNSFDRGT